MQRKPLKKELGYIGLGKMGKNMVAHLKEKGWKVVTFDTHRRGSAKNLRELVISLFPMRIIWIMVPFQAVGEVIEELLIHLTKGDILIDGGNSHYEDSIRRAQELAFKRIHFLDVGVSGGPQGARKGAALMIGGEKQVFKKLEPLFYDLAAKDGYGYMGVSGAGHFVKMMHNGIEYGMMQAIAEGFAVMKQSGFQLDLQEAAKIYNHGSVIESRLMDWLEEAFCEFDKELKDVSGSAAHTGEGEWALKTAEKLKIPVPIIKGAVDFRIRSAAHPSYTGKILSALRNRFGGHHI